MLSATVLVAGSFAQALVGAIELAGAFKKFESMPPFTSDPHKWADLASIHGGEFKQLVDFWLASRVGQERVSTLGEVDLGRPVCSDMFLPYECATCSVAFSTKQGLGVHKRIRHGYGLNVRRMIWGTKCPQCNVEFHSRPRLLQHVAYDGVSCRLSFLESEPYELSLEQTKQLDEADAVAMRILRNRGLPQKLAVLPAMLSSPPDV